MYYDLKKGLDFRVCFLKVAMLKNKGQGFFFFWLFLIQEKGFVYSSVAGL